MRGYLIPDSISFWDATDTTVLEDNVFYKTSIGLNFTGKIEFDNINYFSKKYNDTTFNDYCSPFLTKAISCTIDSIDIVSDKDFDNEHKAGVSLKKISSIRFNTYADFINNNYKTDGLDSIFGGITHRRENLKKYFPDMGRLWVVCPFYIYFTQTPTEHKTHNLTFKFFLDDGRVLCATTEYTFE